MIPYDHRRAEVTSTWKRLMAVADDDDSPEAEELRRLFFGTALDPEEPVSSLRRTLRPNG